jgi:hypothetical protein
LYFAANIPLTIVVISPFQILKRPFEALDSTFSFGAFDCDDSVEAESITKSFPCDITGKRTNLAACSQRLGLLLSVTIIYCWRNLDLNEFGCF